ncbi:MAG: hypothetical protein U0525_04080 [Patescibacteria group bacterium]
MGKEKKQSTGQIVYAWGEVSCEGVPVNPAFPEDRKACRNCYTSGAGRGVEEITFSSGTTLAEIEAYFRENSWKAGVVSDCRQGAHRFLSGTVIDTKNAS